MAAQPPQIRYLQEGKLIGAKSHRGFVATWNWVLSWVFSFFAGRGVTLSGARLGRPRIDVEIQAGDGVDVFCLGAGQPWVISATGGGEVTLRGADDSSVAGNDFTFESAADSNVVATMVEDEDTGVKKVVIGVYYV